MDIMADGAVELDTKHEGAVPVKVMDEGIWILTLDLTAKLLVVLKVTLRVRGDETMLTTELSTTLVKVLGTGVMVNDPEAILLPEREINSATTLGEISTKHETITFDNSTFSPVEISLSGLDRELMVYLYCTVEAPLEKDGIASRLLLYTI